MTWQGIDVDIVMSLSWVSLLKHMLDISDQVPFRNRLFPVVLLTVVYAYEIPVWFYYLSCPVRDDIQTSQQFLVWTLNAHQRHAEHTLSAHWVMNSACNRFCSKQNLWSWFDFAEVKIFMQNAKFLCYQNGFK
jgi:hypothetical protein